MHKKVKKTYKNIYFDLDQTLWDFKASSHKTLIELCNEFFPNKIPNPEDYLSIYYPINDELWVKYRNGEIAKSTLRIKRFQNSLAMFDIYDKNKIEKFCEEYIERAPRQPVVLPHAHEILSYLKKKGYKLFLLTNGFKEVQEIKIKTNNLSQYFEKMITSDDAGYQKPHRKIFEYALKTVNSKKNESIMIGDDINTDIFGAKRFGMDCVYFNPEGKKHDIKVTYEVKSLKDLSIFL